MTNPATARHAFKAIHAAERQLLRAAHRAGLAKLVAELAQHAALAMASKAQAISALCASKIAALDPRLSPEARAAAVARLKFEEAAELATMMMEGTSKAEQSRRDRVAALKAAHRVDRHALHGRQRAERTGLAIGLGRRRRTYRGLARAWAPVRLVAGRIRSR